MAMTTLQHMVFKDAFERLRSDDPTKAFGMSYHQTFDIPPDREIKENGYEGAVEQVYQQMVALGQPA
jgi:hypothetical protein